MTAVKVLTGRSDTSGRLILISETGTILPFPTTPPTLSYSNAATYGQIERTGRKAVTRRVGYGLRKLSFKQTIAAGDYTGSVESSVRRFEEVSAAGVPIRFNGGAPEFQRCWWTVKGFSVDVLALGAANEPSKVEIGWELEEYVAVAASLARTVSPPPPRRPAPGIPSASRTYTVARGDTLWAIAARLLHNGSRWPEIARLNRDRIPNPNVIRAGQVLRIP